MVMNWLFSSPASYEMITKPQKKGRRSRMNNLSKEIHRPFLCAKVLVCKPCILSKRINVTEDCMCRLSNMGKI